MSMVWGSTAAQVYGIAAYKITGDDSYIRDAQTVSSAYHMGANQMYKEAQTFGAAASCSHQ